MKRIPIITALALLASLVGLPAIAGEGPLTGVVLVEAESFAEPGGWVIDQQAMDEMGSPFVLAHGLGVPVKDAATTVKFPAAGTYRVWVRTRDWVAPWNAPGAPGKFQVLVDSQPLPTVFGTEGAQWHWQDGGTVEIAGRSATVALHDLTGFDGRCDAIVFAADPEFTPPNSDPAMRAFRRKMLGLPDTPPDAGCYDLVVVGGGMAGACAAVSAARLGLQVALIQDRPVLGGNNSSEVRVGLSGKINLPPYPALGNLVEEMSPVGYYHFLEAKRHPDLPESQRILALDPVKSIHNAGPASNYEDGKKLRVVQAERNLHLFLNQHAFHVEKEGDRITAVIARHIQTGCEQRFPGKWFVDATGDGTIGFLAAADFRIGRESRQETGESLAPEQSDRLVMGTSVQWNSVEESSPVPFPECPWAVTFNDRTCQRLVKGDWDWETGMTKDQVRQIEEIRDHALRATFGNWAYLKNHATDKAKYANRRLAWVAYIGGKREWRRLLGDVILCQQDVEEAKPYPDAAVTTTWGLDLHYPSPANSKDFPGEEFRSIAKIKKVNPYAIPYRCLYSRNIPNLFMAGRNISVTHVALGTIRVQKTTGMMGEVVGMAASLCKRHNTDPRGVYAEHLAELQALMTQGVPK